MKYGTGITVDRPFDEVVEATKQTLLDHGFGILADMNITEALHFRLGVERRPYRILGACFPEVANEALDADPDIGLLLPCNVVVREDEDGRVSVLFVDPQAVLGIAELPDLAPRAGLVGQRLEAVRREIGEKLGKQP